tara:strand:+ start:497 stop:1036 length:540 start_codon:yes stop_codon:yes gene_type:complete
MIKNILKIIGGFLTVAVVYIAYMILFPVSPKGEANFEADGLNLQVEYHRPYKKGRLIFGEEKDEALVPFGKYWRTGANANTTFEANKDIQFGDQELAAGKYGLSTFPYENAWTITLSSKNDIFFAVSQPDPKMDVIKTSVRPQKLDPELEQFTIDFSQDSTGISLNLKWDKTIVSIPIK